MQYVLYWISQLAWKKRNNDFPLSRAETKFLLRYILVAVHLALPFVSFLLECRKTFE